MIRYVEDKTFLKQFNLSNTTVLHILRKEQMSFHRICSFPYNILVLVYRSDGSRTSYMSGKSQNFYFPLEAGHFYFIPANHVAGVCLSEGMYFVSIQFLLDLYNGLDVFSSVNKILEFEDAAQVKRALEIFKTPGENVWSVKMSGIAFDCIGSIFEKLDPVELNLTEITGFSDILKPNSVTMELVASVRLFMASAVMDTEPDNVPTISLPAHSTALARMPTKPDSLPTLPRTAGSAPFS